MDGQRARDGRAAVDELVGGVDDSFAFVGFEGGPGGFEEVEVAGVAFGAFVYDLGEGVLVVDTFLSLSLSCYSPFFSLFLFLIERLWDLIVFFSYHRNNRFAAVGDFDAAAAVGRAVPDLAAEGCAVEAGGELVG